MELSKILCYDLETTGLDTKNDEILQISIIDGNKKEVYNRYFQPSQEKMEKGWNEKAVELNGLTPDKLKGEDKLKDHLQEIQKLFDGADMLISFNGLKFDNILLKNSGIHIPNVRKRDIMLEFTQLMGEIKDSEEGYTWKGLSKAADYYEYEWTGKQHDALDDSLATLFVAKKIDEEFQGKDSDNNSEDPNKESLFKIIEDIVKEDSHEVLMKFSKNIRNYLTDSLKILKQDDGQLGHLYGRAIVGSIEIIMEHCRLENMILQRLINVLEDSEGETWSAVQDKFKLVDEDIDDDDVIALTSIKGLKADKVTKKDLRTYLQTRLETYNRESDIQTLNDNKESYEPLIDTIEKVLDINEQRIEVLKKLSRVRNQQLLNELGLMLQRYFDFEMDCFYPGYYKLAEDTIKSIHDCPTDFAENANVSENPQHLMIRRLNTALHLMKMLVDDANSMAMPGKKKVMPKVSKIDEQRLTEIEYEIKTRVSIQLNIMLSRYDNQCRNLDEKRQLGEITKNLNSFLHLKEKTQNNPKIDNTIRYSWYILQKFKMMSYDEEVCGSIDELFIDSNGSSLNDSKQRVLYEFYLLLLNRKLNQDTLWKNIKGDENANDDESDSIVPYWVEDVKKKDLSENAKKKGFSEKDFGKKGEDYLYSIKKVSDRTFERDMNIIKDMLYSANNRENYALQAKDKEQEGIFDLSLRKDNKQWMLNETNVILSQEQILLLCKTLLASRTFSKKNVGKIIDSLTVHFDQELQRSLKNELKTYHPVKGVSNAKILGLLYRAISEDRYVSFKYCPVSNRIQEYHNCIPYALIFNDYYLYLILKGNKGDLLSLRVSRIVQSTNEKKADVELGKKISAEERAWKDNELAKIYDFRAHSRYMDTSSFKETHKAIFRYYGDSEALHDIFYDSERFEYFDKDGNAETEKNRSLNEEGKLLQISKGGYVEVETSIMGTGGITRWLMSQGDNVEVIGDESLKNEFNKKIASMLKRNHLNQ
ncbi:exonuclease domain-containing protein [Limosilactobacillus mucosae]